MVIAQRGEKNIVEIVHCVMSIVNWYQLTLAKSSVRTNFQFVHLSTKDNVLHELIQAKGKPHSNRSKILIFCVCIFVKRWGRSHQNESPGNSLALGPLDCSAWGLQDSCSHPGLAVTLLRDNGEVITQFHIMWLVICFALKAEPWG